MMDITGTWLTAEDRQMLRQPEVGGLIIFASNICLLYTSPSPRDRTRSRMPSSA